MLERIDPKIIDEERTRQNSDRVWDQMVDNHRDRLLVHAVYNVFRNRIDRAREILKNLYLRDKDPNLFPVIPRSMRMDVFLKSVFGAKLLSRKIRNGYVELDDQEIAEIQIDISLRKIRDYVRGRRDEIAKIFKDWLPKPSVRVSRSFPPCIQNILNRISNGENIGHYERLILGIYMIRIGKSIDEIVDYYRTLPNFNERKTRYYLEHIHKNNYMMYSCEKIRQLGLCVADCNITNPLQWRD
ncbi:MAG: hypothetical protein NZ908_02460 [Candidatus Micrarchaeota archaeon]|nr:hypothetical protein [Candidatus Micrarchaeota archaeon]